MSYKVPSKHTWPLYGGPPDKGLRANTGKVNIATLKTNSSLLPLSLKKLSSLHYSRIRFNPKCRWAFSKSDIRIATLTRWPRLSFSLSRPHRVSRQGSKTLVNHVVSETLLFCGGFDIKIRQKTQFGRLGRHVSPDTLW